jgi:hypothetical protein
VKYGKRALKSEMPTAGMIVAIELRYSILLKY